MILASDSVFLTTLFFTKLLSVVKPTGVVSNYPLPNWSALLFKLPEEIGRLDSTLDSKLAKSTLLSNCDVSTPVALLKSAYVA